MKVNYHPLTKFAVPAALLLAAGVAQAQSNSSAPAAAAPIAPKTGVLNVRQAIVSTAEGKQASAELQSQFAPRQNELDAMRKQIEDLQGRLSAIQRTGSDEEKTRLQRQGDLLTHQFQRKQDELQEDLNAAQGEVIDRIGRKLIEVLDRYSRENGYTVVFDTSAQNTPVIYASSTIDLTQDIIRLYDQAYPVKGGVPASGQPRSTPATPKPATPPATKPTPPAQKPPQP